MGSISSQAWLEASGLKSGGRSGFVTTQMMGWKKRWRLLGVSKNRGYPKMDGEHHGKPQLIHGWFGGKHPYFWKHPFKYGHLWFRTDPKNISRIGSFPQIGLKTKNIWNQHPGYVSLPECKKMDCYLGYQAICSQLNLSIFGGLCRESRCHIPPYRKRLSTPKCQLVGDSSQLAGGWSFPQKNQSKIHKTPKTFGHETGQMPWMCAAPPMDKELSEGYLKP